MNTQPKQPSIEFEYPVEPIPPDLQFAFSASLSVQVANATSEFVNRFLCFVLPSTNPRTTLVSLAYAAGCDLSYIFGNNEMTTIARALGISKQSFSKQVRTHIDNFGFTHTNTGKSREAKTTYKLTNQHNKH